MQFFFTTGRFLFQCTDRFRRGWQTTFLFHFQCLTTETSLACFLLSMRSYIFRFSSVGSYITYWLMSNFQNKIKTHLILSYQRPVTFCWGLILFFQPLHCTNGRCTGSIMIPRGGETPQPRSYGTPRDKEEVTIHAEDFLKQYFASIAR